MKLLTLFFVILAGLSTAISVRADTWGPPSPRTYRSPSGKFMLKTVPGDWQNGKMASAVILELSKDGNSYTKKREFQLVNLVSPVDACISDEAEVCTFDDWYRAGYEHVLVWYAADGTLKKEYTLDQLFSAKQLAEFKEHHSSKSSIHWRKGAPYFNAPYLIIHDSLGGYVYMTDGKIDYMPQEGK